MTNQKANTAVEDRLSRPCPCCERPTKTTYCAYCSVMVQAEIERPGILRRVEKIVARKSRGGV